MISKLLRGADLESSGSSLAMASESLNMSRFRDRNIATVRAFTRGQKCTSFKQGSFTLNMSRFRDRNIAIVRGPIQGQH